MKPEDCIFFQLAKASQAGTRFLYSRVSALNITPVQAMVMGFLSEQDEVMAGELGKRVELDSATLTGILDRLEAAHLIERKGNPDDRRSVKIHLTAEGRQLGIDVTGRIQEANREFLNPLTEKERAELRELIGKLRKHGAG